MTVLRSREVLPRPPFPRTPTKRTPRKNPPPPPTSTPVGPRTPARADAPVAAPPNAAADLPAPGLGFGAPSPATPRRSPRLAVRSPEAAAESRAPAMGSDVGEEGEEREGTKQRGKRGWVGPGAGGSASRSPPSEGDGGVVGFDLNFPAVEFACGDGRKKGGDRGKAVDLTVSSSSSGSEESRAVRRRVEVIQVESDGAEEEEVAMVASRPRRYSSRQKGKGILVEDDVPSPERARFFEFLDKAGSPVSDSEGDDGEGDGWRQRGRCSEEEKGEQKFLVEGKWLTLGDLGVGVGKTEELLENIPANRRRESDRRKALELAPRFAFFKPEEQEEDSEGGDGPVSPKDDPADWPGPFSTAVKIINEREKLLESRQLNPASAASRLSELKIEWTPSGGGRRDGSLKRLVPPLRDLAVRVLSENADEIESLEGIPNELMHKLSWCICKARKMNERVLDLFVRGSPTEIRVPDCSWATDEQFERIFGSADTGQLAVLQLNLCGRCLPDYTLTKTLARSLNELPSLTTISLKGAYRLSDEGLTSLASAAPLLSSIDLGQCSLITSTGIICLVEKLKLVLRELYLDDCHIDAMSILPALKNLKNLEVLSVAGIESVTNKFVHGLVSVHGASMKELVFTGCKRLTATSLKEIGENCTQLSSLDLRDLVKLDDHALVHLANGCTSLRKLMLRHNSFSDKAVAALLEASGGLLAELSLNNIREVSNFTAQAIAIRCSLNLRILDLSFCRKTTDEGLGLIVDSCSYLRILKVFGCRQITSTFLEGHSNNNVKIIGLEGSILQHLEMPGFS